MKKKIKKLKGMLRGYGVSKDVIENVISKLNEQNEDLINLKIISTDQQINYTLKYKKTEKFNKLEDLLYQKYPQYKNKNTIFLVNGIQVNKDKTLEENNIHNNDSIMLNIVEISTITQDFNIKIISTDQQINDNLKCKKTDKFSKIENILYQKYPQYKNMNTIFLVNGIQVNKDKTLEENNIQNNDTIVLNTIEISTITQDFNIKIISTDQQINDNLKCKKTDKFSKIENILYQKYPQYKNMNTIFLVNGIKVNKDKTLEENNIHNNDSIMLNTVNTTMMRP